MCLKVIDQIYQIFLSNPVVSIDSRTISKGSIFFALKGLNFDGNQYIRSAFDKGAMVAISDDPNYKEYQNVFLVEDVLLCLQELAKHHRQQLGIPVLAITGSNGKTTTKELIFQVLSKKFNVVATSGNLNNHIGVPLTILSFTNETQIGIVEMGANHIGEIKVLCDIAEPDYGIITNIGKAHIEGFGSIEGVIKAKSELFDFLIKTGGTILLNSDNDILNKLVNDYRPVFKYGTNGDIVSSYKIISSYPYLTINVKSEEKILNIESKLAGIYNIENILCAVSVGKVFEVSNKLIEQSISQYTPTNNRSQWLYKKKNNLLLDLYNANPSSMKVALENFNEIEPSGYKKMVILGDMFELGNESESEHDAIVELIENMNFDQVILAGPFFKSLCRKNLAFSNTNELIEYIQRANFENYIILIKASRGMQFERVVEFL